MVWVRSGVMVTYLFFKNSAKMMNKGEESAGAMMRANSLRFVGVFSYRYLRSDYIHTHIHLFAKLNIEKRSPMS
jgi:hypothetical protein